MTFASGSWTFREQARCRLKRCCSPPARGDDKVVARHEAVLGVVVGRRDGAVVEPVVQGIGTVDRDEHVPVQLQVIGQWPGSRGRRRRRRVVVVQAQHLAGVLGQIARDADPLVGRRVGHLEPGLWRAHRGGLGSRVVADPTDFGGVAQVPDQEGDGDAVATGLLPVPHRIGVGVEGEREARDLRRIRPSRWR